MILGAVLISLLFVLLGMLVVAEADFLDSPEQDGDDDAV